MFIHQKKETMKQESSDFFFNRPSFYFGNYQEIENTMETENPSESLFPYILNLSYDHQTHPPASLYLHWDVPDEWEEDLDQGDVQDSSSDFS